MVSLMGFSAVYVCDSYQRHSKSKNIFEHLKKTENVNHNIHFIQLTITKTKMSLIGAYKSLFKCLRKHWVALVQNDPL
jgi:hypothetical protein